MDDSVSTARRALTLSEALQLLCGRNATIGGQLIDCLRQRLIQADEEFIF